MSAPVVTCTGCAHIFIGDPSLHRAIGGRAEAPYTHVMGEKVSGATPFHDVTSTTYRLFGSRNANSLLVALIRARVVPRETGDHSVEYQVMYIQTGR